MGYLSGDQGSFKYGTNKVLKISKGTVKATSGMTDVQTTGDEGYQDAYLHTKKATVSLTAYWDEEGEAPAIDVGEYLETVKFNTKESGTALGYSFPKLGVVSETTTLDVMGVTTYEIECESAGKWTKVIKATP